MESSMNNGNGNNEVARTTPAKLRGNKVHLKFNRLCADWVKQNKRKVAERLRKQARQEIANG